MSGLTKRLEKVERELTPPEMPKIKIAVRFVRGGHGKPIEQTVKGWGLGCIPTDSELDDPATEWEVIQPTNPNWPKPEDAKGAT